MITRIEIISKVFDARADVLYRRFQQEMKQLSKIIVVDVYTIDKKLSASQTSRVFEMLINPVTQTRFRLSQLAADYIVEIGFLPGVTDNVANTTKEMITDLLKVTFYPPENVYTSQVILLTGMSRPQAEAVADSLFNPLIQRASVYKFSQIQKTGLPQVVPKVKLDSENIVDTIDLDLPDDKLITLGKQGIPNRDGTRRGPLALGLDYLKTIRDHYKKLGRKPTDIELESIAQTWSEHCKHTIFADPIDEIKNGLFKHYIKRATAEIRKRKGKRDFCISVFTDNSGAIEFDKDYLVTHKVETHNSPSALDPFGGAITGIVGVNRDAIGFGLGAKPIVNTYGYCFADPKDNKPLYKGPNFTQKMLSSRRIMDGVVAGVNSGGNCSGIATPQGFLYFDKRYKGKPLVFVGTVGLIPRKSTHSTPRFKNRGMLRVDTERRFFLRAKARSLASPNVSNGKKAYLKKAQPGDLIVMIGGRVGLDGIHGATFSSEAMDSGSPATAVQIGDPITQKKLSDALVKEARDLGLYNSVTDNGAGGLSCSVAEMAKECGGCLVELDRVPLKYPGLAPWQTWISESQERMTVAVPKNKWVKFAQLMKKRGVEATVIGTFKNSGKCVVTFKQKTIMDVDMDFLHDGLPVRPLKTTFTPNKYPDPKLLHKINYTREFLQLLGRLNIASFEHISMQYDHEVQASSVIKPLQGKGRVNGDCSVVRPILNSEKGLIISQALYPGYSDIDTYHMAAASIDNAIRNVVAAGGDPNRIALLDNFCWCSSTEAERLGQLKRAVKACYDYATSYGTPFISGKDSMFNDFKGFDEKGTPVKISVPPTLLISAMVVVDNVTDVVSLDAKMPGDLVYILGETNDELGASEYFAMLGAIGNQIARVAARKNFKLYQAFHKAIRQRLVASAQSVGRGGLVVALAKTAMGGKLGIEINLKKIPGKVSRDDFALFSESQGRIVMTVAPGNKNEFEKILKGNSFARVGKVTNKNLFLVTGKKGKIINVSLNEMMRAYKGTFAGY